MRDRRRILDSLEATYREAFAAAKEREDLAAMAKLELDFQRDQLQLEVLLDIRDALAPAEEEPQKERSLIEEGSALIEKAGVLRRIVRLR
jgi:hypothetical protein